MVSRPESPLSVVMSWDNMVESFRDIHYPYEYFESHVFPKLISAELNDLIPRFERTHAWLLDFRPPSGGFQTAHQKFVEDPGDMVAVMKGYLGAWRYSTLNTCLAGWSRHYVEDLKNNPDQNDTQMALDVEEVLQLGNAYSDADFLRAFGNQYMPSIHLEYEQLLRNGTSGSSCDSSELPIVISYRKTVASVKIFVNLLPPAGTGNAKVDEPWPATLLALQKKIFEKPSGAIVSHLVKNMEDEIRTLREDNRRKEKELQKYRGIVSDLSFRHLFEMLAKASYDAQQASKNRGLNHTEPTPPKGGGSQKKNKAGKKSAPPEDPAPETSSKSQNASDDKGRDPQWQDFWKEAWSKASEGTKEGPLRDLWSQSEGKKDIRRGQIRSEGDRIFGLLSANIHDCEVLFETEHCHDSIRRGLLDALKPLEENRKKNGRIDWDEEVKRFI